MKFFKKAARKIVLFNYIRYFDNLIKKYFIGINQNNNRFNRYLDYVDHQLEKTNDEKRINKWLNEEWIVKYNGFIDIFKRNMRFISQCKNAICLGSRTGQEVKALIDLGIDAVGVDLKEFPPYTVKDDIHNLSAKSESFDLVFSNILDHSLYPKLMISEVERVLAPGGVFILHLQLLMDHDEYTVTRVYNIKKLLKFFKILKVIAINKIKNPHDSMDREIILKKE